MISSSGCWFDGEGCEDVLGEALEEDCDGAVGGCNDEPLSWRLELTLLRSTIMKRSEWKLWNNDWWWGKHP